MLAVVYEDLKKTFKSVEEFCDNIDRELYGRILEKGFVGFVKSDKWNILDLNEYDARRSIEQIYKRREYGKQTNTFDGIAKQWQDEVGC